MDQGRIFSFLSERLAAGQRCVLVTVVSVEGSSMRDVGAHMGVGEDGRFAGSLSGGCIENAVVSEALEALERRAPRLVRFGSGSPYIDIKLPCGGGLDIHFLPLGNGELIEACCGAIARRVPFSLTLGLEEPAANFVGAWQKPQFDSTAGQAVIAHWPEPRLLILGHGASVAALTRLAGNMELEAHILTPDTMLVEELQNIRASVTQLATPEDTSAIKSDAWTAIVFLFHDHDWEIQLMARALSLPHFYLGAMGSRRAHTFRTEALKNLGVGEKELDRIHAPIGLFHSSRDPETLALSALGEIVQNYHSQEWTAIG